MDLSTITRIFEETAYVRTGGSTEELRCACMSVIISSCSKQLRSGLQPLRC